MSINTEKLVAIVGVENLLKDESMSAHTTFKVGGPADVYITPCSENELIEILNELKAQNVSCFIMGNGSNLLVGDRGIRGAVIEIGSKFSDYSVNGTEITAMSGIKLSKLGSIALTNSLSGFEFASGIPGTLGGAVFMNAGAYGGEMKEVVKSVKYLDNADGTIKQLTGEECNFGYRTSCFSNMDAVILNTTLVLKHGDKEEIRARMDELSQKRRDKQPLNKPSAGSTFKRPEGYFAGKLIQDSDLKGYRRGGASISEKHSGFVINDKDASAADIKVLIEDVQKIVYDKFGVKLETEVKFVGEF